MKDSLRRAWVWLRWPLAVLVLAYIGVVIYRTNYFFEKDKTDAAVAAIHAQKLTREDVFGLLVAAPDPAQNDATVAGVDTNHNGIRDDVERQIYLNHKDSARVTAAMLQYAKTEQMFLTSVYNTETWKAVAEEDSRAYDCISGTYSRANVKKYIEITDARVKEVADLVFNTNQRKVVKDNAYSFTTSVGTAAGPACDIQPETLQN